MSRVIVFRELCFPAINYSILASQTSEAFHDVKRQLENIFDLIFKLYSKIDELMLLQIERFVQGSSVNTR